MALSGIHRFDEACAAYDRVKAIDPGNVGAEWNLALLHLLTGNFEAGWAGREAHWKTDRQSTYPKFSQPRWFGEENIEGKTILVCADEGLGDTIQFARYVPEVAARGARVILAVEESARALLSGLPGVSQCVRKSVDGLPAFDMHCPMSGLPMLFGTRLDTIPSRGAVFARAAGASRRRPGKTASAPSRQIARRPGLVRQSATRQRP